MYTFCDLFSGSGGMSSGFQATGKFRSIGAVDIEKAKPSAGIGVTNCNLTYEHNIGIKPLFADLSEIAPNEVSSHFGFKKGELDVLISCAPCTGFSQKSAQNHIVDDPRNTLVARTALFVDAFRPKFLIMENVKELIKGRHLHHFRELARQVENIGYEIVAEVHDLSEFGLPQKRRRALVVAKLNGDPNIFIHKKSQIVSVREAISHMPKLAAGQKCLVDPMHICPSHTDLTIERMQAIPVNGGSWTDIPESKEHLLIPSMKTKRTGSFPDIYGRMWWDKPAPTVTRECGSPGNGRYTHPEQDRLLSVREMALIQGFPSGYHFSGKVSSRYNQIGDAVPPMIAQKIADAVALDLEGKIPDNVDVNGQIKMKMTTN